MSIGAWEPANKSANEDARAGIDRALLKRAIGAVQDPANLAENFSAEDQTASFLIRLPAAQWLEESSAWDSQQTWNLIQFFVLAEMQFPDWHAGAESPVIPLAKSLRQRKAPLNREQLQWIKQHSDNRYLPYGPL